MNTPKQPENPPASDQFHYDVFVADTLSELCAGVSEAMNKGWRIQGAPFKSEGLWYQCVVAIPVPKPQMRDVHEEAFKTALGAFSEAYAAAAAMLAERSKNDGR